MTQDFITNKKKWKFSDPKFNSKNYYFIELFTSAHKDLKYNDPNNMKVYHEDYSGEYLLNDIKNSFRYDIDGAWSELVSYDTIIQMANKGSLGFVTNDLWEFGSLSKEDFLKLKCDQSYSRNKGLRDQYCNIENNFKYHLKYLKYKKKYLALKKIINNY